MERLIQMQPASCLKYYENHEFQFQDHSNVEDMIHDASKQYYQNSKGLRGILEDGTRPWYLGTKYSNLLGLMKLYYVKGKHGWSDQGFTTLLEVFFDMFLENNNVPKSMYVFKKIMKVLGLHYETIHACKKDCILF